MRLEFEPNSSAVPFVENEVVSQDLSSEVERMLREGVRAAQEGKRAEARQLLLRVTEADAESENAWLWLASISEYPEELLVFLNNVLRINQQNERALEWHKATKSLLAKTLVQRGVEAANENRREFARQCFEQALEHESENEMAWLWMASVADSDDEKEACFAKVLSVNPENESALESMRAIQSHKTQKLFQEALSSAFDGRHTEALDALENVLSRDSELEDAWVLKSHLAASFEERAECLLKVRALNPENEMARAALASWRMLSEKVVVEPQAEAAVEEAPAAATVAGEEASFADLNAELSSETAEFAEAANESASEPEAEPQAEFAAETEAEQEVLEAHETNAEVLEASEPEAVYADESTAPTQDLSLDAVSPQPEMTAFETPETVFEAPEAERFAEREENHQEELQTDEVSFDASEADAAEFAEPSTHLKAELEAEEAEMNWAFTYPDEDKDAEDYFKASDEDDDIHKTHQANYEPQDFALRSAVEADAEKTDEVLVEEVNEAQNEEWRDTSPGVFVNYSPFAAAENSFEEAPTLQFSAFDASSAESLNDGNAEAQMSAPPPAFEDDFSEPRAEGLTEEKAAEAFEESAEMLAEETFEAEVMAEEVFEAEVVAEEAALPEETPALPKVETVLCPFCDAVNDKQAFSCSACQTVLTLSDLEMLLASSVSDEDKLRRSVDSLERENESYGLSAEQMTSLGVGHVNLKNHRQGFFYLQEAVRMNPSNVLLGAQVNALAIRLTEMEEQQSVHDSMPKNRKILVVDDSPTVRKLISGKLEKCGHEVVCAVDGVDALEKINELVPDLVLLDITMPRMDGYQVCKLIRNNEVTKDVPVVMISGKDGFFDKVRGRMAGTSGYITKPFGPETLMKTVETYLN